MDSYFFIYITLMYYMFMILILTKNLINLHPFVFMGLLMIYTMILCYNLNFLNMNFMFSYILFLVMIGGLMILFMYFTSLVSNQLLTMKYKKIHMFESMLLFIFFTLLYYNEVSFYDLLMMHKSLELNSFKMIFLNMNNLFINMIMDYCIEMNFYMIFYLFLMMICSVLICLKAYVPLRQMII